MKQKSALKEKFLLRSTREVQSQGKALPLPHKWQEKQVTTERHDLLSESVQQKHP
jgi:hypothetical protein